MNLTDTGQLMVMGVKESLSGTYTCTLSHNILETTPPEERETVEVYKFMLYGKMLHFAGKGTMWPLVFGGL